MARKLFINLPVLDLERSKAFYDGLGFSADPRFSDDTAVAITIDDTLHVMLLTHGKFAEFSPNPIADTAKVTAALNCLSCASRTEVDALAARAEASGGRIDWRSAQDYGFMYGRSVQDPDGHVWELMWMDEAQMAQSVEAN